MDWTSRVTAHAALWPFISTSHASSQFYINVVGTDWNHFEIQWKFVLFILIKIQLKKILIFLAEFVFYEALLMLHCTTAIEMQTIQKTVKNTNKKIFQLIYNKQNHTKKKNQNMMMQKEIINNHWKLKNEIAYSCRFSKSLRAKI